jgi:hypothetical protein
MMRSKSTSTTALAFPLIFIAASMSGCGKAAREGAELAAKKIDEALSTKNTNGIEEAAAVPQPPVGGLDELKAYLAVKIPTAAARALRAKSDEETPYTLYPYEAELSGEASVQGASFPASISFRLSRKCAWLLQMEMTVFTEEYGSLYRLDTIYSMEERFDHSAAFEQAYTEIALVDEPTSDTGQLISKELEQSLIEKTASGFRVKFESPIDDEAVSDTDAMLELESEQHVLSQLQAGNTEFTYRLADTASEQLFTEESVRAQSFSDSALGTLWSVAAATYDTVEGESLRTAQSTEIMTENGFPLYVAFDMEGIALEAWLERFKRTETEVCE